MLELEQFHYITYTTFHLALMKTVHASAFHFAN